jgi:hypothetical protein
MPVHCRIKRVDRRTGNPEADSDAFLLQDVNRRFDCHHSGHIYFLHLAAFDYRGIAVAAFVL